MPIKGAVATGFAPRPVTAASAWRSAGGDETLDPANPKYQWVDRGEVIESASGQDNWNAIDANIILDEAQQPWMTFGSFWSGIKLLRIDAVTGKPQANATMYSPAARPKPDAVEAPFMIRRQGFYYLSVSFDYCPNTTTRGVAVNATAVHLCNNTPNQQGVANSIAWGSWL